MTDREDGNAASQAATNGELTLLLERARGDEQALEELVAAVYQELRRTARRLLRGEASGFTLVATDLVHEAYLRLFDQPPSWDDRRHFFGSAAIAMRRVLVDHARRKQAGKRIPRDELLPLELSSEPFELPDLDLVALDRALDRLARVHPRQARIVELRFFAGLSESEVAELLGISRVTVTRDWKVARLRLRREMR
jgi:RNA polymerase sigma factor (TIGR02999 family)